MSVQTVDALAFAGRLLTAGIPVVVCRANPNYRPGGTEPDVLPPAGWNQLTVADVDLSSYRPGVDTLAMVGGHGVDVVDVDVKDGGDVSNLPPFRWFGRTRTPSGGWHYYVRSTGIGKISPLRTSAGHVGDYVGGTPAGGGRMLAYLPGSARPKYPGATYVVVDPLDLEALVEHDPDDELVGALLAAGGTVTGEAGAPAASAREVAEFVAAHAAPPGVVCSYGRTAVEAMLREAEQAVPGDTVRGRHGWAVRSATRCVELIRGGCATVDDLDRIGATLTRIKPEGDDWTGIVAWALANAKRPTGCGLHNGPRRPAATAAVGEHPPAALDARRDALGRLLADLRTWQHLPDPTHVVASLAVAATRDSDGEACWLLLVAPPSSGKTEAVRVLDDAADARLDEVTSAGLLGWSKGKTVRPTGVLARVGERALVTFGDLSTLLATSDRGGRDQVFGHLRRAYDGHVSRDISPPGKVAEGMPERLEWSGRLTVVGCVTGAIDRYTAHADQLGARWLYVRLPERDTAEKRRAAVLARRGLLGEHRARARELAAQLLAGIRADHELPDDLALLIEDAALVTAWGRGSVPRNGYGRREIEGMPVVEEPMRLVQQLGSIARGVLALGLPAAAAAYVARRVALDSMPEARRAVLAALAAGEVLSTSGVARAAGIDRKVARFQLEELAAIGVVTHDRVDDEDEELAGAVHWFLAGEDGALIARVFSEHHRIGGWDETWLYTSTSPPEREQEPTGTGRQPTFRPTPDGALTRDDAPPDAEPTCTCGRPLWSQASRERGLCGRCADEARTA